MNAPRSTTPFDPGDSTSNISDERLRAFAQLTPLQRLQWVEQCSHFVRLAQAAKEQTVASRQPVTIKGQRNNAVLVSAEDWQAIQETRGLLQAQRPHA